MPRIWQARAAFWSAFPLVAPQGLWLRATATRLDAPPGERTGVLDGSPVRLLLVLGDSVVDGVGADSVASALAGCTAAALSDHLGCGVRWQAVGRNGARIDDLLGELLAACPREPQDAVLVSVGVNDVTGLTRSGVWSRKLGRLLDVLRERNPDAALLLTGVPPLAHFPVIPWPLRPVLALRGRTFDRISDAICAERSGCRFVPTDFVPEPEDFAEDGYHPGPRGYAQWGPMLAEELAGMLG